MIDPRHVRTRRAIRAAVVVLLAALGLTTGARAAVHWLPGFGPWLADGLRSIVGVGAVSRLEELSAEIDDRVKRWLRNSEPSRSLSEARPVPAASPTVPPDQAAPEFEAPRQPRRVGAMARKVAAPGDGEWLAVPDFEQAAQLFATMLHPDSERPWAEVFIVAVEVGKISVHAVAGTREPVATTSEGRLYQRRGLIPPHDRSRLVGAFNGGFKTEHGAHGMLVDGVTLVPPQDHLCAFVGFADGRLAIGTWKEIKSDVARAAAESQLLFWRQAAPCMYEGDKLNARLRNRDARNWGATLDGKVVIRRSAVGISASGDFLYIGISNDTTARAMADAMHHAGASDIAQLDVNWSYPKILVYRPLQGGQLRAESLFKGFQFRDGEYVERPSTRDFFYLVRTPRPGLTVAPALPPP